MRLEHSKKLHAVAVAVLPLAGTVVAVLLARRWGLGPLELGLLCLMYSLSMVGITVGFHRCFAHGSFEAAPWVRAALAICGSMACQGPLIYWVANHRLHHRFTDAPGDPHSPYFHGTTPLGKLRGLWHAHLGWTYSHEIPDTVTYARDLLRSPVLRHLSRLYFVWLGLGLALPALLGGLLTLSLEGALRGLLWGGFVRIFVAYQSASPSAPLPTAMAAGPSTSVDTAPTARCSRCPPLEKAGTRTTTPSPTRACSASSGGRWTPGPSCSGGSRRSAGCGTSRFRPPVPSRPGAPRPEESWGTEASPAERAARAAAASLPRIPQ